MIRIVVAIAGLALAGPAAAQTWGQPAYVDPYGHAVGGTPLSEVETRSYVTTGRWADGYSGQAYVHAPVPAYGARHEPYRSHVHGHRGHGYRHGRYAPRSGPGYRDVWGYNDDRPPSARSRSRERRSNYQDRDCGCGDVYLYDR